MNQISRNSKSPSRFGFLVLNNFTLISLSAALGPLRMANRLSDRQHFTWKLLSETGEAVSSSDHISVNVDCSIQDDSALRDIDILVVCGGIRVQDNFNNNVLRFLRTVTQKGLSIGALCTGSKVLAEAGLLDGYRCSIHWEDLGALNDIHPEIIVRQNLYTIDRNRYTSSGGTAPMDLVLNLIKAQLGAQISASVAEQFICDRIRGDEDQQRIPLKHIIGNQSDKLITAVQLMEANLREPISQEDLARYVGLSRRQLQRLFHKYLLCAPSRYYLQLRLNRARELLQQTGKSILEVTADCGFVSTSHFSKSYKAHFGYSPSVERQRFAASCGNGDAHLDS